MNSAIKVIEVVGGVIKNVPVAASVKNSLVHFPFGLKRKFKN